MLGEGDGLNAVNFRQHTSTLSALSPLRAYQSNTRAPPPLTEGIDTSSLGRKLVFHIFGALAEYEREMVRERTKAGLKSAKGRGRKLGRPAALSEAQIEMARAMRATGKHSMREIAKQLGVSRATLYRVLNVSTQT